MKTVSVIAVTASIVAAPPIGATSVERAALQPIAAVTVVVRIGTHNEEPMSVKTMVPEVSVMKYDMMPEVMMTDCEVGVDREVTDTGKVMATSRKMMAASEMPTGMPATMACFRGVEGACERQQR